MYGKSSWAMFVVSIGLLLILVSNAVPAEGGTSVRVLVAGVVLALAGLARILYKNRRRSL